MKSLNIILVGFMGTGKSTVGRMVADRLKRPFIDMDEVIEERAGKRISDIFSDDGEECFRKMERELVQDLSRRQEQVIAPGGGVVLDPENISDFSRTGIVVCLHADPETILKRVSGDTHRPLLENDDKAGAVTELLNKRRHLYDAIPWRIDTTNMTQNQVADRVIEILDDHASSGESNSLNSSEGSLSS